MQKVGQIQHEVGNIRPGEDFSGASHRINKITDEMRNDPNLDAWNREHLPEEYQRKFRERDARLGLAGSSGSSGSRSPGQGIDGVYYPGDLAAEPASDGFPVMAVAVSGLGGLGVTAIVGALVFSLVGGKEPEEGEGQGADEEGLVMSDPTPTPTPPPFENPGGQSLG